MNLFEHRLRLRRRDYQQRRRHVAELEALAHRLRADERRLQQELVEAVAVASAAGRSMETAPLVERHRKLAGSVAAVELQLAEATAALVAAEHDLKRQEAARVSRIARAAATLPPRARKRARPVPIA